MQIFDNLRLTPYHLFFLFVSLLYSFNVKAKDLPSPVNKVPIYSQQLVIEEWTAGLDEPWGLSFISDGVALVTEKKGNLLVITRDSKKKVIGVPSVTNKGQGGLLDVALDPNYSLNGWVYLSFSDMDKNNPEKSMTKIVRGKLSYSSKSITWENEEVLFQANLKIT